MRSLNRAARRSLLGGALVLGTLAVLAVKHGLAVLQAAVSAW